MTPAVAKDRPTRRSEINRHIGVYRDVSKADSTLTTSANAANISVTDILHETRYAPRCDVAVDASGVSHPACARGWRTAWLRHHARRESRHEWCPPSRSRHALRLLEPYAR